MHNDINNTEFVLDDFDKVMLHFTSALVISSGIDPAKFISDDESEASSIGVILCAAANMAHEFETFKVFRQMKEQYDAGETENEDNEKSPS